MSLNAGMIRGAAVFTYSPNCGISAACSWILAWLSSTDSSVTSAVNVSVPYSTVIVGLARRLYTQSGLSGRSALRAEHGELIALDECDEGDLTEFARLGPDRVEDHQRGRLGIGLSALLGVLLLMLVVTQFHVWRAEKRRHAAPGLRWRVHSWSVKGPR